MTAHMAWAAGFHSILHVQSHMDGALMMTQALDRTLEGRLQLRRTRKFSEPLKER